jgi:hypothetical protein
MSDPTSGEVGASVATVIRGFTDAELALHDVALAIERFSTAAQQLSEAREDQAAARLALAESAQATDRVAVQVSGVVDGLRETTAVLRGIDPDRLWRDLDKIVGQQITAAAMTEAWMTRFWVEAQQIEVQQKTTAAAIEARMMALDGASRRLAWLASGALVAGLIAVALLVAIVGGLVAVR